MKTLEKSNNNVWLNVASSIYVLDNFINLDNHFFIRLIKFYSIFKIILPKKYHTLLDSYYEANKKATIQKHDCRKKLKYEDNSVDHILCSHFLEHVFPEDADFIISDFYRVLKPGGTLHMIVPDLKLQIDKYYLDKEAGKKNAADIFITESILSRPSKGTFKYRIMEFGGGFGLQHRWMYDSESLNLILSKFGFLFANEEKMPSSFFRRNDGSVHAYCVK